MTDQLPDVKLTNEQQEERAAAIRVELVSWFARDKAARLIVSQQDKVTDLERKIETCGLQCSATMKSLMAENTHYKQRVAALERENVMRFEQARHFAELSAGLPIPFTHWSKDPLVPYAGCSCSTCHDARIVVTTTTGTTETTGDAPVFQVGDKVIIKPSTSAPRFSLVRGIISGPLAEYEYFDEEGELAGKRLAYKVMANGEEVCAPPDMLIARGHQAE